MSLKWVSLIFVTLFAPLSFAGAQCPKGWQCVSIRSSALSCSEIKRVMSSYDIITNGSGVYFSKNSMAQRGYTNEQICDHFYGRDYHAGAALPVPSTDGNFFGCAINRVAFSCKPPHIGH